jgi:hypothetical protein
MVSTRRQVITPNIASARRSDRVGHRTADLTSARGVAVLVDVLDQQSAGRDLLEAAVMRGSTRLPARALAAHGDLRPSEDDLVTHRTTRSLESLQAKVARRSSTAADEVNRTDQTAP